jgi:hypothetical protein
MLTLRWSAEVPSHGAWVSFPYASLRHKLQAIRGIYRQMASQSQHHVLYNVGAFEFFWHSFLSPTMTVMISLSRLLVSLYDIQLLDQQKRYVESRMLKVQEN